MIIFFMERGNWQYLRGVQLMHLFGHVFSMVRFTVNLTCFIINSILFCMLYGGIQKVHQLKIPIFDSPPPFSSLFVLHVPHSSYVCFFEFPHLSQKKFRDIYEFLNAKSGSKKRENNYFFKLSIKITVFTQLYIAPITTEIFTSS